MVGEYFSFEIPAIRPPLFFFSPHSSFCVIHPLFFFAPQLPISRLRFLAPLISKQKQSTPHIYHMYSQIKAQKQRTSFLSRDKDRSNRVSDFVVYPVVVFWSSSPLFALHLPLSPAPTGNSRHLHRYFNPVRHRR